MRLVSWLQLPRLTCALARTPTVVYVLVCGHKRGSDSPARRIGRIGVKMRGACVRCPKIAFALCLVVETFLSVLFAKKR